MASTKDLQAGWEIYRNSGFRLSLDEVNDRLQALTFAPISDRAWDHYQRMRRRGFRSYIPINRLDTMHVADPFRNDATRSRYKPNQTSAAVQLVVHSLASQIEVVGVASSIDDAGVDVVVSDPEQRDAIRELGLPPGTPATVHFLSPPLTQYGQITYISSVDPEVAVLGLSFSELLPVQKVIGGVSLETALYRVRMSNAGDHPGLDAVSQDIYWLLQVVESARSITNALALGLSITERVEAPPATVRHLRVASPLDARLEVSIRVWGLINALILRFADSIDGIGRLRQAIGGGGSSESEQADAELVRAHADNIRAQTEGIRLNNRVKEIGIEVFAETSSLLIEDMRARGLAHRDVPQLDAAELFARLGRDVLPSLSEFGERGTDYLAEAEGDQADDSDGPDEGQDQ